MYTQSILLDDPLPLNQYTPPFCRWHLVKNYQLNVTLNRINIYPPPPPPPKRGGGGGGVSIKKLSKFLFELSIGTGYSEKHR